MWVQWHHTSRHTHITACNHGRGVWVVQGFLYALDQAILVFTVQAGKHLFLESWATAVWCRTDWHATFHYRHIISRRHRHDPPHRHPSAQLRQAQDRRNFSTSGEVTKSSVRLQFKIAVPHSSSHCCHYAKVKKHPNTVSDHPELMWRMCMHIAEFRMHMHVNKKRCCVPTFSMGKGRSTWWSEAFFHRWVCAYLILVSNTNKVLDQLTAL